MKDTSVIPHGDYCYTWIEFPSVSNNFIGKTKACPYADIKNINGVHVPWCNYLDLGGTPGDGKGPGWEDYDKAIDTLNKHFGSEEETDKQLSLFLLFDGCKECGVNKYDDENYI